MKQNQNFNQLRNRLKKYNINWKMNQCMTVLIRIWPHRFLIFTLLYGTEGSNKDKVVGMRFIINIFCMHDYYWLKRKMPGEGRVLYPFTHPCTQMICTILYFPCPRPYSAGWKGQAFVFERTEDLRFGLVQDKAGLRVRDPMRWCQTIL